MRSNVPMNIFKSLSCQYVKNRFYFYFLYSNTRAVWVPSTWEWNTTLWLVFLLRRGGCILNVTHTVSHLVGLQYKCDFSRYCMYAQYIYTYIPTHNCCNLGYVFLYQHVRATFSGFSHLFILTSNGLKEMIHNTVFRLLIIRCWHGIFHDGVNFSSSEPELKLTPFNLHAQRKKKTCTL